MSRLSPLRPEDPQQLGGYLLNGRIGAGGQGVVFHATGPDGSPVAVKLLRARLTGDGGDRRRFVGEVQAVRRVAPFCTAQVLDADLDGDRPYIVSEYIDGVSLQEYVRAYGPRSDGALDRVAVGTATALAAIHRAGVIHRDFKPANVLIGADGPRVIDFGISRLLDATTTTGGPVGTPAYLAPEQLRAEPVGPACDMFSWALTVAFAASGRHAFAADTYGAILARILYGTPDLGPLDGPLREIVVACLASEPRDRPTAEEVLGRLLGGGGAAVPAPAQAFAAPPAQASAAPAAQAQQSYGPMGGRDDAPVLAYGDDGARGSATVPRGIDRTLPGSGGTAAGFPTADGEARGEGAAGRAGAPAVPEGAPVQRSGGLRRRWPLLAAGIAVVAALAGGAVFLAPQGGHVRGGGDVRADGGGGAAAAHDGMWIGVARYPAASRTFPIEIYLSGSSRMRWGADLHCEGRLTRRKETGGDLVLRLDQVTGKSCYAGTVVFRTKDDRQATVDVIKSGSDEVAYTGRLARDS
ncbi:serine/threonine-protein kinase [Microtetraspora fusca]|uniref:serine/threonine-protein kinase n=1 Tax=Microtetraspora fusca TaxID=1997 RepID=UPI0009FFF6B4|nr:serine/threonine-protein kinase [Microtetraspora fusca]